MSVQINTYNEIVNRRNHEKESSMRKKILLLTIIATFFAIISTPACTTHHSMRSDTASETGSRLINTSGEIQRSNNEILDATLVIDDETQNIRKESDSIINSTTDAEIITSTRSILQSNRTIAEKNFKINEKAQDIKDDVVILRDSAKSVQGLEDKLADVQNEGNQIARGKLYEMLAVMFAAGGLIVIGGITLAFFNPKLGAYLAGFGLIVTTVAVAGTYYLQWIAIVGFVLLGVGLLITLGFLIWSFWKARIYGQANVANVKILEEVKGDLLPEEKEKIFGDEGFASSVQPKAVKKEIKRIRNKIL